MDGFVISPALASIGVPGILTLAVLAVLFGWMFPRATVTRLWAQLDAKDTENKELRDALDKLTSAVEKVVDQLGDQKTTQQAILYAMQEIQVAGRHAAGLEPLPRSPMQLQTDGTAS
jgi:hypothetical protein